MARKTPDRDLVPKIEAAQLWIKTCLIEDGSLFGPQPLWTAGNLDMAHSAFVVAPAPGDDDFMAKFKGQLKSCAPEIQQLAAEILWALLLFPSNMRARTKREQIRTVASLSGQDISPTHPLLADSVLEGIGSGGPAFNNYRPAELNFLVEAARNLKTKSLDGRDSIFRDYTRFVDWMEGVPQTGKRQYRHMLRYFAFPDEVERMSSNRDRRKILAAFRIAPSAEIRNWSDRKLDEALFTLRQQLEKTYPSQILDFYRPPLSESWKQAHLVRTEQGVVPVVVPSDDDEEEGEAPVTPVEARQSIQVQAKLAEIGAIMGFKIWAPRSDRSRVLALAKDGIANAFLGELPLNYDEATLDTIEQIDIIWLKGRSIARAFEVEHTTAVYSGLLRMADLLALQPNMDIRLHIVAPEERRDKVFREMLRPVFTLLDRGPLSRSCTFLSYDSVTTISGIDHLSYMSDRLLEEYEEKASSA